MLGGCSAEEAFEKSEGRPTPPAPDGFLLPTIGRSDRGAEKGLGYGHHLHRHRRELALPRWRQGSVQRRVGWLSPRQPHDTEPGDAGAIPRCCRQTTWQGADPPLGLWQSILRSRLPKLLRHFGMQVSMSPKGNCWDNAPMESCWGSLKTELVHHRRFSTREQAKREITEYIEIFC
jgi:hypothetical protein